MRARWGPTRTSRRLSLGEGGRIVGWAVGCDLTRRDLQAEAKKAGRPWDAAKGFDQSAPCGAVTLGALPDPAGRIELSVNGQVRQSSRLDDMILNPDRIVEEAGKLWALQAGDLIFTGTPSGVGPVGRGDTVVATIDGLETLRFEIV
jgi:fumarylpyruvate hydrolase